MIRFLGLLSACLVSSPILASLDSIPIGTGLRTVKEESIKAPYKETENYTYAKGVVFNRWVYNPWVKVQDDSNGQLASLQGEEKETGYVSAEISASTHNLDSAKTYTLKAQVSFDCEKNPAVSLSETCINEFVVRCYGFVNGSWTRTLDETRIQKVSDTSGVFEITDIPVTREQCAESIHMTLKSHINKGVKGYLFKNLKVGFVPPSEANKS